MLRTRIYKQHWFAVVVFVVAIIAVLMSLPPCRARLLVNVALLSELRGEYHLDWYRLAFEWHSDDHIRWQAGIAMARAGEFEEAADMLFPLVDRLGSDLSADAWFLDVMAQARRRNELPTLLAKLNPSRVHAMPSNFAAMAMLSLTDQPQPFFADWEQLLLAQALGFVPRSDEFRLLTGDLSKSEDWSTPLGKHVRSILELRSQQSPNFGAQGRAAVFSKGDDFQERVRAAQLIGLSSDQVSLGPELGINGGFEISSHSLCGRQQTSCEFADWSLSIMANSAPWNRAAFVIGADMQHTFIGNRSLRIDGLIVEHRPDLEPARAGLAHAAIPLQPLQPYLVSFAYTTDTMVEKPASIYLTGNAEVFYLQELRLPPSNDTWKRVTIILWNPTQTEVFLYPLLRSFAEGTVWFDEFTIRRIITFESVQSRQAVIDIREAH